MFSSLPLIPSYLPFSTELINLQSELQSLLPGQGSALEAHLTQTASSWARDQRDQGMRPPAELSAGAWDACSSFPRYTISSDQRSPPPPTSPLLTRLHSPIALVLSDTQTPVSSHLLQLCQSLQYLSTFSPFTHLLSLFPFFFVGFLFFQHNLPWKKLFLLLPPIHDMCCAY